MNLVIPDYYTKFECLKDKCKHSCCTLWQIDIDNETLEYYKTVSGDLGERLADNIVTKEGIASFKMTSDERCPFLTKEGLCDIVLKIGKDALCDICNDHPSFRNYYTNFVEMGYGICCEAAGKLILSNKERVNLVSYSHNNENTVVTKSESELLKYREYLFDIISDRSIQVSERVDKIEKGLSLTDSIDTNDFAKFLLDLERLDSRWFVLLTRINDPNQYRDIIIKNHPEFEYAFEQLLIYMLYRHLPETLHSGESPKLVTLFCIAMYRMIYQIAVADSNFVWKFTIDNLVDICRLWSTEIEYSDENPTLIKKYLKGRYMNT